MLIKNSFQELVSVASSAAKVVCPSTGGATRSRQIWERTGRRREGTDTAAVSGNSFLQCPGQRTVVGFSYKQVKRS